MEDVGVTKLTQELVELKGKVWVLILTSLILMLYQMNLYFSIEAGLPEHLRVTRAALLLTGHAATWFRAQGWDSATITWPQL